MLMWVRSLDKGSSTDKEGASNGLRHLCSFSFMPYSREMHQPLTHSRSILSHSLLIRLLSLTWRFVFVTLHRRNTSII
jgi:hypothetical protein